MFAELTKHHVFEGRHADKLITLVNNDVASPEIKASVLDAYSLGKEAVESFMLERLVAAEESDKPKTPFSARLAKVKAPTMANIYDVVINPNDITDKKVVSVNRRMMQRIVAAKLAGREVDFEKAAAHEALSVPINIFKTDGSMRDGTKSTLVDAILKAAEVTPVDSVPGVDPEDSQHVVDAMFLIHQMKIDRIQTFRDFSDRFNSIIYRMPSNRIDVAGDRYDEPSTKDSCRTKRAKPKKGSRRQKQPVEKMVDLALDFPKNETEFKLFLKLKINCTKLLNMLGTRLIENAPAHKTITATGMFLDPEEVRSNKLQPQQLRALQCDREEADTRVVPSVVQCPSKYSFVVSNDTDTLIGLVGNENHFPANKRVYLQRKRDDFINVSKVSKNLAAKRISCKALTIFHPLTGMDQTSFMHTIGKPSAFTVYLHHQLGKHKL